MHIFILILSLHIFAFISTRTTYAIITSKQTPSPVYTNSGGTITFTITSDTNNTFVLGEDYSFGIWPPGSDVNNKNNIKNIFYNKPTDDKSIIAFVSPIQGEFAKVGTWHYKLWLGRGTTTLNASSLLHTGVYYIYRPGNPDGSGELRLEMDGKVFQATTNATLYINNVQAGQDYTVWFDGEKDVLFSDQFDASKITTDVHGHQKSITTQIPVGGIANNKTVCLTLAKPFLGLNSSLGLSCDYQLSISVQATPPPALSQPPIQSGNVGIPTGPPAPTAAPTHPPPLTPCIRDASGKCTAVASAIGNIPTDPAEFVKKIFTVLLSMASGWATYLIVTGGYMLMFSHGEAEPVKEAREKITSAIVGIVFMLLSLVILRVIGVDIFALPTFGN